MERSATVEAGDSVSTQARSSWHSEPTEMENLNMTVQRPPQPGQHQHWHRQKDSSSTVYPRLLQHFSDAE